MSDSYHDNYWFNYILNEDPQKIKETIQVEYIDSEGLKLHLDIYDNQNSGKNTIIFIHGTSVYSRFYAEFCYCLYREGYRVIALDLIGHGLSEGKRGHFTLQKFTKNVYDVTSYAINKFGENIVVIGSSLGGITTLYCAANDDRLKGAICHNAAILNEKAHKRIVKVKGFFKYLKPLVPSLSRILPTFRLSVFLYLDFNKLAKSEYLDKIDIILNDPLLSSKYTLKALRSQMKESLKKPIESIEIPVMIINGDDDFLFSVEYMKEIYDRLNCKHKKLEIIKNASHLIFHENINETIKKIIQWLSIVF